MRHFRECIYHPPHFDINTSWRVSKATAQIRRQAMRTDSNQTEVALNSPAKILMASLIGTTI